MKERTEEKKINPDKILRRISFRNGDGAKSEKLRRQVSRELEGLPKDKRIQRLKEMFPGDVVWKEYDIQS